MKQCFMNHAPKRRMKGVTFLQSVPVQIIAVLAFFAVVLGVVIAAAVAGSGGWEELCKTFPILCGGLVDFEDDSSTIAAEAIHCAIIWTAGHEIRNNIITTECGEFTGGGPNDALLAGEGGTGGGENPYWFPTGAGAAPLFSPIAGPISFSPAEIAGAFVFQTETASIEGAVDGERIGFERELRLVMPVSLGPARITQDVLVYRTEDGIETNTCLPPSGEDIDNGNIGLVLRASVKLCVLSSSQALVFCDPNDGGFISSIHTDARYDLSAPVSPIPEGKDGGAYAVRVYDPRPDASEETALVNIPSEKFTECAAVKEGADVTIEFVKIEGTEEYEILSYEVNGKEYCKLYQYPDRYSTTMVFKGWIPADALISTSAFTAGTDVPDERDECTPLYPIFRFRDDNRPGLRHADIFFFFDREWLWALTAWGSTNKLYDYAIPVNENPPGGDRSRNFYTFDRGTDIGTDTDGDGVVDNNIPDGRMDNGISYIVEHELLPHAMCKVFGAGGSDWQNSYAVEKLFAIFTRNDIRYSFENGLEALFSSVMEDQFQGASPDFDVPGAWWNPGSWGIWDGYSGEGLRCDHRIGIIYPIGEDKEFVPKTYWDDSKKDSQTDPYGSQTAISKMNEEISIMLSEVERYPTFCQREFGSDSTLGETPTTVDCVFPGTGEFETPDLGVSGWQSFWGSGNRDIALGCTVRNLRISQEVSKAAEWIINYGDPQYLFYWQTFPQTEDTWTFKADWKVFALITAVAAIPPLKAGKAAFKLGSTIAKEVAERRIIHGMMGETVRLISKKEALKLVLKDRLKKIVLARVTAKGAKAVLGSSLRNVASKRGVIIAGTLSGAALVAAQLDSLMGKWNAHPNSLVLKKPYEKEEVFDLGESLEGVPVFIKWNPFGITAPRERPMHLVSPCKIESMPVTETTFECGSYMFNVESKLTACEEYRERESSANMDCDINKYLTAMGLNVDMDYLTKNEIDKALIEDYLHISYSYPADCKYTDDEGDECSGTITTGAGTTLQVTLFNEDRPEGDEVFERIKITDISNDIIILLMDTGKYTNGVFEELSEFDNKFDTYVLNDCNAKSIMLGEIKYQPVEEGELNYCADFRDSTGMAIKSWGGVALGVGGIIASGFFTGGTAWIGGVVLWTTAIGGAALEVSTVIEEYDGHWPGNGASANANTPPSITKFY